MTSKLAPEFKLDLDIYLVAHDFLKVYSAIVVLTIYDIDMQSEEREASYLLYLFTSMYLVLVLLNTHNVSPILFRYLLKHIIAYIEM